MATRRVVVPPTNEPVTLGEAKAQCRIDGSADDELLTLLIASARRHGEAVTRRVWAQSDWDVSIGGPLLGAMTIPIAPCSACLWVQVDGVPVDPSAYTFIPSGGHPLESPLLPVLTPGETFPSGSTVTVRLRAGWDAALFPADLKSWMLVRISGLYEQRENFATGHVVGDMPRTFVDCLLDAYFIPGGM